MLQLAEVIYHNQHPFVRLPDNFPIKNNRVYIRPNMQTGNLELVQTYDEWDEMKKMLQAIGKVEELPEIERAPTIYRDPVSGES